MPIQIVLSIEPAADMWGKNALLSFHSTQAIIHFTEKKDRTLVQKAARKLRG